MGPPLAPLAHGTVNRAQHPAGLAQCLGRSVGRLPEAERRALVVDAVGEQPERLRLGSPAWPPAPRTRSTAAGMSSTRYDSCTPGSAPCDGMMFSGGLVSSVRHAPG